VVFVCSVSGVCRGRLTDFRTYNLSRRTVLDGSYYVEYKNNFRVTVDAYIVSRSDLERERELSKGTIKACRHVV
jgi:hypothetical protein